MCVKARHGCMYTAARAGTLRQVNLRTCLPVKLAGVGSFTFSKRCCFRRWRMTEAIYQHPLECPCMYLRHHHRHHHTTTTAADAITTKSNSSNKSEKISSEEEQKEIPYSLLFMLSTASIILCKIIR